MSLMRCSGIPMAIFCAITFKTKYLFLNELILLFYAPSDWCGNNTIVAKVLMCIEWLTNVRIHIYIHKAVNQTFRLHGQEPQRRNPSISCKITKSFERAMIILENCLILLHVVNALYFFVGVYLKLDGRNIDSRNHFSAGMFHLKSRIQL